MPFTSNTSSATSKGTNNWLSAASVAAQNAAIISSSGWGSSLPTAGDGIITPTSSSIGPTKMLADFVKESAAWQTGSSFNSTTTNHHTTNATSSMPWAAAVKAPSLIEQQQQQHHQSQQQQLQHVSSSSALSISSSMAAVQSAFESNNTMGSWNSPETSSSNRGGWNADGSSRNNGVFDDGTAIWGNPSTKKTGIDWTEKESSLNPQQANNNNSNSSNSNSEKRIQKSEPMISSLNGTEAWGAPVGNGNSNAGANLAIKQQQILPNNNSNSQQQLKLNDNGGNTYGSKSAASETLSWGESSSLQQQATKNENSSPPSSNSVWNTSTTTTSSNHNQMNDIVGPRSANSDWLANLSANSTSIISNSRIEELKKQLEATSLFNSTSSLDKNSSSNNIDISNNSNIDNQSSSTIGVNLANGYISANGPGMGLVGSSAINDLKQTMSANFSNDLIDSSNRQSNPLPAGNNPQSQLNSSAYSIGVTPSRDLLKQMVHQIQLAVQAGHLNAHILNQPMSTPTLQLVYTLLQQIKTLHQLQEIQQRSMNKSSDLGSPSNLDLQQNINRVQQSISLLQKAITQQQAALTKNQTELKQQQHQQQQQQQQAANNFSYATISKLSTNTKVPSSNYMSTINNSNLDSFSRSSLIDTLSNSNSDSLRSAQATFEANANIDKTLSPILQAQANNILSKNDFTNSSECNFTSGDLNSQQAQKNNLLAAQQQMASPQQQSHLPTTSSSSAPSSNWLAFSSAGDFTQQGWPQRISSNASRQDQQQFANLDLLSELENGKNWRSSSLLSSGGSSKDNNPSPSSSSSIAASIGAGVCISGPNSSAPNSLKQISENDILNRDQSLFYDWSNNTSDNNKRNHDSPSSFNSSALGGLSLQSNPWLFAPTSASLNIGTGMNNVIGKSGGGGDNVGGDKFDNGCADVNKMSGGADPIGFMRSNNSSGNIQRSPPAALYDWSELASSALQFNPDENNVVQPKRTTSSSGGCSSSSSIASGSRPAPPPGLMSNNSFGSIIGNNSAVNGMISSNSGPKLGSSDESHLPSKESSSSLWSGTWYD